MAPAYGIPLFDIVRGDPSSPNAAIRARIADKLLRIFLLDAKRMARDHERCGKASCARSKRCRGFACDQELDDRAPPRRDIAPQH